MDIAAAAEQAASTAAGAGHRVLVVDDHEQARLMISRFLKRMGYAVDTAANGLEALVAVENGAPDIIVMDLSMPVMGGFEATERIRAASGRWIPIVFLSATPDSASLISALERGADDYLVKPISYTVLRAKMHAVSRTLGLHRELEERNAKLAAYRAAEEEQNRMAEHVIRGLASQNLVDETVLQHWIAPAGFFSGDLVAAARTPSGALHIMLADGTGHGLAAALSALPVTQPFYRMTHKGYSLPTIAEEMNRKIRRLLPVERFVAATLIAVDFKQQLVEVWNGGNPPLCVLSDSGRLLHVARSAHPPLGVVPDHLFNSNLDVYRFEERCQVFACSDGVYEAAGWQRSLTQADHLAALLGPHAPETRMDVLKAHCSAESRALTDDIAVVGVTCAPGASAAPKETPADVVVGKPAGDWRFEVKLGVEQLRKIDVVPLLHDLVTRFHGSCERDSKLFLVLSELVSNALDHGLLGLDSRMKLENDGFQRYLALRQEKLAALAHGSIELRISAVDQAGEPMLRMRVTDTGPGFDFERVLERVPDVTAPFGRGIPLVKRLCQRLDYRGCGNDVEVLFAVERSARPE